LGGTGSANHLDDYEEGTWTPVLTRSTTAPTLTYGFQNGHYTKIGRQVILQCSLRITAVSSVGAGTLQVSGLPFTPSISSNQAYGQAGIVHYNTALPGTANYKSCFIYASSVVNFESSATVQDTNELNGDPETGYLSFQIAYLA
jgi:hypothetical protein